MDATLGFKPSISLPELISRQETAVVSTPADADAVIQKDWTPLRQRRREEKQISNYVKKKLNGRQSTVGGKTGWNPEEFMQEMTSRKTENITLNKQTNKQKVFKVICLYFMSVSVLSTDQPCSGRALLQKTVVWSCSLLQVLGHCHHQFLLQHLSQST